MAHAGCVETDRRARARCDMLADGVRGDQRGPAAEQAAPSIGLEPERGESDDVGMSHEKTDYLRDLVEIPLMHRGVEQYRQPETSSALDVLPADLVEIALRIVALALLGRVDVESHVDQTGGAQLGQQITRRADAVGKQRGPHAPCADPPDDLDKLRPLAQRGVAAGHLHLRKRTVEGVDHVDAPLDLLERQVYDGLRGFG